MVANARSHLRERTRQVHLQIEACRYNRALLGSTLTRKDLVDYLVCQRAIWQEVRRQAEQHLPDLWRPSMCRVAAIEADLEALGVVSTSNEPAGIAESVLNWWCFHGATDQAAGFLYVLEGSSLGGLTLVPHLERQGFAEATRSCAPYGRRAGIEVHAFCERLEASGRDLEAMGEGAAIGFRMLGAMLDQIGEETA